MASERMLVVAYFMLVYCLLVVLFSNIPTNNPITGLIVTFIFPAIITTGILYYVLKLVVA